MIESRNRPAFYAVNDEANDATHDQLQRPYPVGTRPLYLARGTESCYRKHNNFELKN
jgi:hypothetical protein